MENNRCDKPTSENSAAFAHLRSHFVGIHLVCSTSDSFQSSVYSSFVLSVSNHWFLITAGHCLKYIHEALAYPHWNICQLSLLDASAPAAKHHMPLPYPIKIEHTRFYVDDDGLDLGILPVPDLIRTALMANGIQAMDEIIWDNPPADDSSYWLMGIPEESVTSRQKNGHAAKIETITSLNAVERLATRPIDIQDKAGLNFFGKVALSSKQKSLVGMSGGPIFAARNNTDGTFTYWLVAVQSCWVPSSRHIGACHTWPLAQFLREQIKTLTDPSGKS